MNELAPVQQSFSPPAKPQQTAPLVEDVRGSAAANTLRAYASDCRAWEAWCRAEGRHPLPADPADVRDYLISLASERKASTIARRVAAIGWAHRAKGYPFNADAPAIAFALKRIRREHGAAKHGKDPLTTPEIKALLAHLPAGLAGIRDRAILLLGYASALRRSEIAALDLTDVNFEREGITVILRRSKGDQTGKGQVVGIAYGRREATCPVRAIQAWIRAAEIGSGPLFRQLRGNVVLVDRLGDKGVYRVIKRACAAAGLDPARYGAHSMRSGHVTTALANGADPIAARNQARHKDLNTTLIYDRRRQSLKNSTSRKLGL